MAQNLFKPVYNRLEQEFKELSYCIAFDKKNLSVFSIKIADMILRTVSECENIARAICQKEGIKFLDKKRQTRKVIYFYEYIDELDKIFGLSKWLVSFKFENSSEDIFISKSTPFRKDIKTKNGKKEIDDWCWYDAYNSIKHNRNKYFKKANLENLIYGLEALFLLNIIFEDKVFYKEEYEDYKALYSEIEEFSDVFDIDVAVKVIEEFEQSNPYKDNFLNPLRYMQIIKDYSAYLIEHDIFIKTPSDKGADIHSDIENSIVLQQPDGTFKPLHENAKKADHKTKCALVARVNRICNQ